jgi:hypothetical protein
LSTQPCVAAKAVYRNFNLCPHCMAHGQEALLQRLCEGIPMISRSDGETFHLLLADRPLPYPLECAAGPTKKFSLCFWYSPVGEPSKTHCTIVLLNGTRIQYPAVFRRIELVADLLAEELALKDELAEFYELCEDLDTPRTQPAYAPLYNLPLTETAR